MSFFPVSSAFSFSPVLGRVAVLLPGGTVEMIWESWVCPLSQESCFPSSAAEEVHLGAGK